jgi:hypothetical protein
MVAGVVTGTATDDGGAGAGTGVVFSGAGLAGTAVGTPEVLPLILL